MTPQPTGQPTTAAPTPCGGMEIKIELLTDNYPSETSWQLNNTCSNDVIGSPTNLYIEAKKTYSNTYCMPQGRYEYTIKDSYNDG